MTDQAKTEEKTDKSYMDIRNKKQAEVVKKAKEAAVKEKGN